VRIGQADGTVVDGDLAVPDGATGVVVFAHCSGSSRHSRRNRQVADATEQRGLATLLMDLLTAEEEAVDVRSAELRFDIELSAPHLSDGAIMIISRYRPAILAGYPLSACSNGTFRQATRPPAEPASPAAVAVASASWMTTEAGARSLNTNGTSVLTSPLPSSSVRRSSQISLRALANAGSVEGCSGVAAGSPSFW
jgi:putative phosphoribosyl transferase